MRRNARTPTRVMAVPVERDLEEMTLEEDLGGSHRTHTRVAMDKRTA
jgi:hypothetical protein